MEKDGFSRWVRRIRRAQDLFDEFRIDHFRGFAGFWVVPSEAKIAVVSRWKVGPGKPLFDSIYRTVGKINIIAEDLELIEQKQLPNFQAFAAEEEEGSGGYGTVYRATRKSYGRRFAIKCPHCNTNRQHVLNKVKMLERYGSKLI